MAKLEPIIAVRMKWLDWATAEINVADGRSVHAYYFYPWAFGEKGVTRDGD